MINKMFIYGFIFIVFNFESIYSSNLPSFITPCYRDDADFNKCVFKEAHRVQKRFIEGIPEMGVAPMDPLYLGDYEIFPPNNAVKVMNKNAVSKGLKDAVISEFVLDLKNKTGYCRMSGNSSFKADYVVNGQIFFLPVTGKGVSKVKTINFDMVIRWHWILKKGKDGKQYAYITDATQTQDIEHMVIRMDGLFNNNKALGDALNKALNENWRDLMRDLGPPSLRVVQERIVSIFNNFFEKVPFDEIFPLRPKN